MAFSGFSAVTSTPVIDTEESPTTQASSTPPLNSSSTPTAVMTERRQPFTRPYVSRFRAEFDHHSSEGDSKEGPAVAARDNSSEPLLDQSARPLEYDGALDSTEAQHEDLYRAHGLPLDTIDELSSEASTDSIEVLPKSPSRLSRGRRGHPNRLSSSAPELCLPEGTVHDFGILFPSLVRRASSLHGPGPLSPLERSECEGSVKNAPSSLSSSSSPRPSTEGCRSTQSAPNLSPAKRRIAQTLGDIARILRGQSPNTRTTSPIATWPSHGVRLESLQQPTAISSIVSLEDAASGPSVEKAYLESAESIDPTLFPRPLTVRNRSSLDSLPSVASSCEKSGNGANGADISPPAPLFVQMSPFGSREDLEHCRYTADGVPIYNGSWPSMRSADLSADSAAFNQVSASPNSSVLIQSRDLYEGTPRTMETNEDLARPAMDNFTRLRLSGRSSNSDPFFDASETFSNQQGCLQASINALTRTSQNESSRGGAPANLSLWPEPLQIVSASPPRPTRRVSSHTGLLATASNRQSHCADNMSTSVTARSLCKHGNPLTRRVLLAGTRRLVKTDPERGQRCAKCEWGSLKDGVQRRLSATLPSCYRKAAARSAREAEPLDSLEAILMQSRRKPSIKARPRVETPEPPVKEWLAISSEPGSAHRRAVNLGNGKGIVYVPRHSGKTPPASLVKCPHGKERKCLRCTVSRVGRNALIWITVTCFCQDIAADAGSPAADMRAKTVELKQAKRRSEIE